MKYVFASVLALASLSGVAQTNEMFEITSAQVLTDDAMVLDSFSSEMTIDATPVDEREQLSLKAGNLATVGEVIQIGRDLVALGEEIYTLVQRGRPVVSTQYAPISVLPNQNGRAVSAMELEGWRMPVSRTLTINYKNVYGMTMASLQYKLIFAYGGSFNGRGAYITNAQLVPAEVYAFYGVDFNVEMRLSGITNQGSRANPVAGAMLQIHYKAATFMNTRERNDTYQITGLGAVQKL